MSQPEQPFDPRRQAQPSREHLPPPADPQAPADYPDHSHGYPPPPPPDSHAPVNYPGYSHGYPPPPPPPVDPHTPINYPDYSHGYPPPPAYYPPPYQAGPTGYPSYSGHPGYPSHSGYPGYPDPYGPYRPTTKPGTNGLAIASLVASIGGFPLIFINYIGFGAWIAGIVLGIVALSQVRQTHQEGRALAIAGIAVGTVGLVIAALAVILLFANYSTPTTY